jgi:hypothetical protein
MIYRKIIILSSLFMVFLYGCGHNPSINQTKKSSENSMDVSWEYAAKQNTFRGYSEYIKKWPHSSHAQEAIKKIEFLTYEIARNHPASEKFYNIIWRDKKNNFGVIFNVNFMYRAPIGYYWKPDIPKHYAEISCFPLAKAEKPKVQIQCVPFTEIKKIRFVNAQNIVVSLINGDMVTGIVKLNEERVFVKDTGSVSMRLEPTFIGFGDTYLQNMDEYLYKANAKNKTLAQYFREIYLPLAVFIYDDKWESIEFIWNNH